MRMLIQNLTEVCQYQYIDIWKQWYEGHVRNFHDYFVFNGVNKVPCQKLTTGLAKQACEEWANRIANEKLAVTLEGEREQAFFDEVCRKNHFRQMINRYQELSFALGGSACVARTAASRNAPSPPRSARETRSTAICSCIFWTAPECTRFRIISTAWKTTR